MPAAQMPTLQEIYDHLGIDFVDAATERNCLLYLQAAEAYLQGAICNPLPADARVKVLALTVTADLYDNRTLDSTKVGAAARKLVSDFTLQLRLEARTE